MFLYNYVLNPISRKGKILPKKTDEKHRWERFPESLAHASRCALPNFPPAADAIQSVRLRAASLVARFGCRDTPA
jgi:hypothetical protein